MMHSVQSLVGSFFGGLVAHLTQWDGWAVLIAAALLTYLGDPAWVPVIAALLINPLLLGLLGGLMHGHHLGLNSVAVFTVYQVGVAYLGFLAARIVTRLR